MLDVVGSFECRAEVIRADIEKIGRRDIRMALSHCSRNARAQFRASLMNLFTRRECSNAKSKIFRARCMKEESRSYATAEICRRHPTCWSGSNPKRRTMSSHQECIDTCNSLLRGELSAIETYGQAIEKFRDATEQRTLEILRAEHVSSAQVLRHHLKEMGAQPSTSSGAWGTFAKAVEGTATMLGKSPALAALEEGEKHGIDEYRDALENEDVMEEIKDKIRQNLIPSLETHLKTLASLRAE